VTCRAILLCMKVVVSGANGFLGSWICRVLHEEHQVVGMVRPGSSERNLLGISGINIKRIEESSFNTEISRESPDVVILCDWWGVGNEFRNDDFQFTNVERVRSRISALKEIPTVIGVGSQAEVGPKSIVITENEIDSPTTKYGLAKVKARKILESTLNEDVRLVWGRIFSTYGPLDSESWLIPSTIRKLLRHQSVDLTRGEQEWSFLHAYDLGQAFKSIIENMQIQGVVNIGNPETITIFETAQFIGSFMGKSELLNFGRISYREDQVMKLAPASEKLTKAGWSPKIDLRNGIPHLIGWMSGVDSIELKTTDAKFLDLSLPSYKSIK
jgi:nucleoside-diphosphate-sugar epimerase